MLSKSSKWELGLVHYIEKFTISRFVISRFECAYIFFYLITDVEMHMRKDHGRFLFSMFGPVRPYKCNKCERSLDKDPSQDTHTCLPTYVPSRKGNHVTEADLKCEKCNKKFTKRGGLFR